LQIKTKIVSCHTADSKPVKQEVNGTLILSPLVFPAEVEMPSRVKRTCLFRLSLKYFNKKFNNIGHRCRRRHFNGHQISGHHPRFRNCAGDRTTSWPTVYCIIVSKLWCSPMFEEILTPDVNKNVTLFRGADKLGQNDFTRGQANSTGVPPDQKK
jgi:hypothetical protein